MDIECVRVSEVDWNLRVSVYGFQSKETMLILFPCTLRALHQVSSLNSSFAALWFSFDVGFVSSLQKQRLFLLSDVYCFCFTFFCSILNFAVSVLFV